MFGNLRRVTIFLAILGLTGCGGSSTRTTGGPGSDARTYLFGMRGDTLGLEDFVAVTDDPDVQQRAASELALPEFRRDLHLSGDVAAGDGGHNLSWSWHVVPPDSWDLVSNSIELCDTSPVVIEQSLSPWDQVGICPWNSYVKADITGNQIQ